MSSHPAADPADPVYSIRVSGHLDAHWSGRFGRLVLSHGSDATTALRGPVIDQAELHAIIGTIRDLGLELLTVSRAPSQPPPPPASPATGHHRSMTDATER